MAHKHPGTSPEDRRAIAGLSARHAAAVEHYLAGRLDTALPLLEQIVFGCRAVLGERHPDTLTAEGNLAVAYVRAGHDDGRAAVEDTYAAREHEFGSDDPRTLTALECLATVHRLAGDTGAAIRVGEAVVAARERVLGPAHPDTLVSRLGLGLAHGEAPAVRQAVAVLAAALADAEAAHGPRHRHTIEIRAALACCHAVNGELVAAAEAYDRAIVDAVGLLGTDHPVAVALREERCGLPE
jgi:Tetratricopeptide repeat